MLKVSSYPHISSETTTRKIMFIVIAALMPAFFGSIFFFGIRALIITLISIVSSFACEALCQAIRKKPITINDGSAILTGLLLAFNLPSCVPYWVPVVGAFFAIAVAKQVFGGLGYNIFNPALAGRAFLMASWPSIMTGKWVVPRLGTMSGIIYSLPVQMTSNATPLTALKDYSSVLGLPELLNAKSTIYSLFLGMRGGCLGETSCLLLLIGGIILISFRIIDFRIPLSYFLAVFSLTGILWLLGVTPVTPLFHILSGGLFLGAFFMATDYVTSPMTRKGRWIFGIGCGIITVLIRLWGGYPEGVSYSILLMNATTPLIDKFTRSRIFGY